MRTPFRLRPGPATAAEDPAGSNRTIWSPGAAAGTSRPGISDREDWRTFRVDRIRPRTPTGPRFVPRELPGGTVSAFITDRFRGSDGTGTDWPCRGEVILDVPATAVAPFAQDGIVEALAPDRCRLLLGSWSWTGLAAAIGRFDADIEVVGPPDLTSAFAQLATRCAKAAATTAL